MVKYLLYAKKAMPFLVLALMMVASHAFAISEPDMVPDTFRDLNSAIGTIFDVVIIVSAIVFVVLFLIGGIQYLTAAGNEDQAGKARKMLLQAVIGLVIVLASWGIGSWIIDILTGGEVDIQTDA